MGVSVRAWQQLAEPGFPLGIDLLGDEVSL